MAPWWCPTIVSDFVAQRTNVRGASPLAVNFGWVLRVIESARGANLAANKKLPGDNDHAKKGEGSCQWRMTNRNYCFPG